MKKRTLLWTWIAVGITLGTVDAQVNASDIIQFEDNIAENNGVSVLTNRIGSTDYGDWVRLNPIDFGTGTAKILYLSAGVPWDAYHKYTKTEFRLDSLNGPVIAYHRMEGSGGFATFRTQWAPLVSSPQGVRSVYVVFDTEASGKTIGDFDWVSFSDSVPSSYNRDAGKRIEAESFHDFYDVRLRDGRLSHWNPGSWACFHDVDFGVGGFDSLLINLSMGDNVAWWTKRFAFVVDSMGGDTIAVHQTTPTPDWDIYEDQKTHLWGSISGVHDLYIFGIRDPEGSGGIGTLDNFYFTGATTPNILVEPKNDTVSIGMTGNFFVDAAGQAPLSYSWKRISGGTETDAGSGSSLLLPNVQLSDDGSLFYCIVSNSLGSQISDTAILTVVDTLPPPIVSVVPSSLTAALDTTFTLTATLSQGGSDVQFQWQKDSTDILGATATTYSVSNVKYADRGSYRVIATNNSGKDTSNAVQVTVPYDDPKASVSPDVISALVGQDVTFRATIDGSPPLRIAWLSVPPSDTLSRADTLVLSNVQLSQHMKRYYVQVLNDAKWGISNQCTLKVYEPVVADFTPDVTAGTDSLIVTFTNNSSGSITRWEWDFGDGSTQTDTVKKATVRHTYTENGDYTATLVVSGPGIAGSDTLNSPTLYVRDSLNNPVVIESAGLLSPSVVRVSISGYEQIEPLLVTQLEYADSIGLWVSRTGQAIDPSTDPDWMVDVQEVQKSAGTYTFPDLTVPTPTLPSDTSYLFWASPIGRDGPKPYDKVNAKSVRMVPQNPLLIDASYLGNTGTVQDVTLDTVRLDSVAASISNVFSVSTETVDTVLLAWRYLQSDIWNEKVYSLTDLRAMAIDNIFRWGIEHNGFMSDTQQVIIGASVRGKNRLVSARVFDTLTVGWPGEPNPFSLHAGTASSSTIPLWWNRVTGVDSIRIVYGTSELLPGQVTTDIAGVSVAFPPFSDTSFTLSGLSNSTTYYVGIQQFINRRWTALTDSSIDSATTEGASGMVTNTASIDSIFFQSTTNRFVLSWRTGAQIPGLEVGIGWSTDSTEAFSRTPSKTEYGLTFTAIADSGTTSIDPGIDLQFGVTYYFTLWLRTPSTNWSPPTEASSDTCSSQSASWQTVRLFLTDSISVFNGSVRLWKDEGYKPPLSATYDTLRLTSLSSVPQDYSQIGPAVRMWLSASDTIHVGVTYDSIPVGLTSKDVGLFKDSAGVLLAMHGSRIDPYRKTVFAKVVDFFDPSGAPYAFVALADRKRPEFAIGTNPEAGVSADSSLTLRAHVTDNARNVAWKVLYAKDDEPWSEARAISGIGCGSCTNGDSIEARIPAERVTDAVGVRAFMVLNDGVHRDTINVSHRVRRTNSDILVASGGEWTPVWATGDLDSTSAEYALAKLTGSENWTYDPRVFRLFRYLPTAENRDKPENEKWLEYSEARSDTFRFIPGRVFWVKTKGSVQFGLGAGRTSSMTDTLAITLPAGQWTDFALPYNRFNVRIGDILAASGLDPESIHLFEWRRSAETGQYFSNPIFSKVLPQGAVGRVSDALDSYTRKAYTVYNAAKTSLELKIPPVSARLSEFRPDGAGKKLQQGAWCFQVFAQLEDGSELGPIYVAYSADSSLRSTYLPLSPSFGKIRAGIADPNQTVLHGHVVAHRLENGGFSARIVIQNSGPDMKIAGFRIEKNPMTPLDVMAQVIENEDSGEEGSIALRSGKSLHRIIAVGSPEYVTSVRALPTKPLLKNVYPNPFRGQVKIEYYAPPASVAAVDLRMFDSRGRMVFRTLERRNGFQTLFVETHDNNGTNIPSGMYLLQLTFIGHDGARKGTHTKRLISVQY